MSQDAADFQPSVLGTQQYWDSVYDRELKEFKDIGDVGEIWFGEEVQIRILKWMEGEADICHESRILDIGCGNGVFLLAMRTEGYTNLTGVDYSEQAIQLSTSVLEKEGVTDVRLQTSDILTPESVAAVCQAGRFDVCHDKGTYDALSLRDPLKSDDRIIYRKHVTSLLSDRGLLIITSCNWTREELEKHFLTDFELVHEIPAPKFTFGGKTGQIVTTLVLRKISPI